ncbi:MAG: hypothetical protein LBJ00_00460, partial [Planctomycetaceae bacterium]|nr:hypothetical protein [Planctomycetaceae bacterium]
MAYPTVPVLNKTFSGGDEIFNGNKGVAFKDENGPVIQGQIVMTAIIWVESWDDVKDQFHYIISQNNGDNTQPENFLRIRGNGTRVIFECGAWINGANHEIGFDFDPSKHIGVELYIAAGYDSGEKKWYMRVNDEEITSTTTDNVGAVAVPDGRWMIGTHNFAGKERYFKGKIFYAAVYDAALTGDSIIVTDSDNNGIVSDYSKNATRAEAEHDMGSDANNPTAKPITYFPSTVSPVPDDYKHVQVRIIPGAVTNLTKYRLKCTGNLEVVRGTKTGTSITYSATAIADTTDILP